MKAPQTTPFLVVEIPGDGLPGAEFTLTHPGVTIDGISQKPVQRGADLYVPMLFMIRGADSTSLDELVMLMTKAVGSIETLRRDERDGTWLGRGTVREADVRNAGIQAIFQFQHRLGPPWTHSEGGVVHLRAPVKEPGEAERLLHQVRGFMADCKVDAHVELQEFSPHDHSVWDELVQYSLGMQT